MAAVDVVAVALKEPVASGNQLANVAGCGLGRFVGGDGLFERRGEVAIQSFDQQRQAGLPVFGVAIAAEPGDAAADAELLERKFQTLPWVDAFVICDLDDTLELFAAFDLLDRRGDGLGLADSAEVRPRGSDVAVGKKKRSGLAGSVLHGAFVYGALLGGELRGWVGFD